MNKYRKETPIVPLGTKTNHFGGTTTSYTTTNLWDESLSSIGHYGWQAPQRFGNVGGPFSVVRTQVVHNPSARLTCEYPPSYGYTYVGSFAAPTPATITPDIIDPNQYGATAYSRMKPAKPEFNAVNSLIELRDLPGMATQTIKSFKDLKNLPGQLQEEFSRRDLKDLGDHHLAIQFGWLPLWRDCQKLYQIQKTLDKRLSQLIRDNGRPIRRRVWLKNTSVNSTPVISTGNYYGSPVLATGHYVGSGTQRTWTQVNKKVWASARFRYFLPPYRSESYWKKAMIARLYGVVPTPAQIYNSIPWSWLIDWFSNTGDILSNMDTGVANRIAAEYFYIMCETEIINNVEVNWLMKPNTNLPGYVSLSASAERRWTSKSRTPGDPFGWNTSPGSLSAMQLSILGALGSSRL